MKVSLGELRTLVREVTADCWGGSRPEEMYEEESVDDPSFKKRSVLVPDDVKRPVTGYLKAMGLAGTRRKKRLR
jgi:hypothetical protein